MELVNSTDMQAGFTISIDPDGREHIVLVVKGTFDFPTNGRDAPLADEQVPIIEADTFTGDPGRSATVYEAEYPLRKPLCDVLLNGSAYAPGGKPTKSVRVGMKVGALSKVFNVVGDRNWQSRGATVIASAPRPFTVMPINYDRAFGGTDDLHPDASKHSAYLLNPVGRGYHKQQASELIDDRPLPNTEESGTRVTSPTGKYRPMSFGPVGRGWNPRLSFAGTYDEDWLANVFPFLPPDFDDAYFQCAPEDQQIQTPGGGEEVVLINLTPEGRAAFNLPRIEVPVTFFRRRAARVSTEAVLDTIVIEPDLRRFMLAWRVNLPLRRNIFEVKQAVVGGMPRAWWRAMESGKPYYRSIGSLVRARQVEDV